MLVMTVIDGCAASETKALVVCGGLVNASFRYCCPPDSVMQKESADWSS